MFKIVFFILTLIHALDARFATESETDSTIESYIEEYNIHKDGSFTVTVESTTLLKTEAARDQQSKMMLTYREGVEKIAVLEAKTITNNKTYNVQKKHIEDKQLASSSNGFEDKRQVIVAFPKAEVGSRLYAKIKITSHLMITKNHFYTVLSPLNESWTKKYKMVIKSKIPLFYKVHDPFCIMDMKVQKKHGDQQFTQATVELKKEGTALIVDDVYGYLTPSKRTWISFSSLENWDDILKDLIPQYEKILSQKLPALYQSIYEDAQKKENPEDQMRFIMSSLNEKVQYLGAWMTFKGLFVPRSLSDVEKTRFADCKDFSTALVIILRKLGLKADVAFVSRGEGTLNNEHELLPFFFANHAIVKAVDKNGTVYWLDPTNFTSSTFIYPDIADRSALVLTYDNKQPISKLEHIPATKPFCYDRQDTINVTNDHRLEHDLIISASETTRQAAMLTGIHLRIPETILEDQLFSSVAGQTVHKKDRTKSKVPTLTDRIIQPLTFELGFIADDLISSNIGFAYIIKSNILLIELIDMVKDDDVNDWNIDLPGEYVGNYRIKCKKVSNLESLALDIDTPWFMVKRTAVIDDEDTVITNRVIIKMQYIPNDQLKSEIFKKAQKDIIKKFKKFVINFE